MKIRQLYAYELRPAAALVMETYSRMEQPYVANPKEIEMALFIAVCSVLAVTTSRILRAATYLLLDVYKRQNQDCGGSRKY